MSATRSAIKAGKVVIELGTTSTVQQGLNRASAQLKAFGAQVAKIGAGISAASAAILGPLAASVNVFSDQGDEIAKMSRRTGIAVQSLTELKHAAGLSGSDLGTLEKGVRKMQRALSDAASGSSAALEPLQALGLSISYLASLSPEEQFLRIGEALGSVSDASMKAALAQEIFGRAGTGLIPLFNEGADGIERMRNEALALGLSFDDDAAASAERLNDNIARLKSTFKAITLQLGQSLAPAINGILETIQPLVSDVVVWVQNNRELVVSVAAVAAIVGVGGAAITAFGLVIASAGLALSGFTAALAAFNSVAAITALLVSPVTALVAILIGSIVFASAIILKETGVIDKAMEKIRGVIASIKEEAKGISAELKVEPVSVAEFDDPAGSASPFGSDRSADRMRRLQEELRADFASEREKEIANVWREAGEREAAAREAADAQIITEQELNDTISRITENRLKKLRGINERFRREEQERRLAAADEVAEREAELSRRREDVAFDLENKLLRLSGETKKADLALVTRELDKLRNEFLGDADITDQIDRLKSAEALNAAESATEANLGSFGSFRAADLRGVFGGDDGKRTADAAESTARNTKELIRAVRESALVFR